MRPSAYPLAAVVLLAGCGDAGGSVSGGPGVWTLDGLPPIELVEELRIGSLDDPDEGFSRLGNRVHVTEGDTVWVPEQASLQLRVYAPDGRLVRRMGRAGDGPGELRTLILSWGIHGDTVWVRDLQRITLFRRDGTFLSTLPPTAVRVEEPPVVATVTAFSMLPDGRFEGGMSYNVPPAGSPSVTLRVPRLIFDAQGETADTLGYSDVTIEQRENRMVGPVNVGAVTVPATAPLSWFLTGDTVRVLRPPAEQPAQGTLTVLRIGERGDTTVKRDLTYQPTPVPSAFRDSVVAARVQTSAARSGDPAALERAIRAMVSFPDYHPPVATLTVTDDGSIWLRRAPPEPDRWRWVLLAPDATLRGEVTTAPGATILWSDGERVYVGEQDEFEVPWLVRYRITGARR